MANSIDTHFTPPAPPRIEPQVTQPVTPPPAARPPEKPTIHFNDSSFEAARPTRSSVDLQGGPPASWQMTPTPIPSPTLRQTPTPGTGGVYQTGGTQGDGKLEPSEYIRVNTSSGLNLRSEPTTTSTIDSKFEDGVILKVATPEDGGASVTDDGAWVYVEGPKGETGWVSTKYVQELPESEAAVLRANDAAIEPYRTFYVDQVQAELQVKSVDGTPSDGVSGNCGPSSLVVAFHQQGIVMPSIPGLTDTTSNKPMEDGASVQAMRYAMYEGMDGMDGVAKDEQGNITGYNTAENSEFTTFVAMKRAVDKSNGTAEMLPDPPTTTDIQTAVNAGKTVIVSGTFEGKGEDQPWAHYDSTTDHVIAVVGTTPEGNFIVCDPAFPDSKPIVVTPTQLDNFMKDNAGAMSVDGPPNTVG